MLHKIFFSFFIISLFKCIRTNEVPEADVILHDPKIEASKPDSNVIDRIDGCTFRTNGFKSVICIGQQCRNFSAPIGLQPEILVITTTKIRSLHKNAFQKFNRLRSLEIIFNVELDNIEVGCFRNLSTLIKLSISFNYRLKYLDERMFEDLINLKELYLMRNGFYRVADITKALSVKRVPQLSLLNLNKNVFDSIEKDDFKPMVGTNLTTLQLVLCQTDFIHEMSFNPLKNLRELYLGQNQFNVTILENLIAEMLKQKIPLQSLSIDDAGFRRTTPVPLLKLIAEMNVTHLNLSHNIFDNLRMDSFPYMPNVVVLDVSNCLLLDIASGAFEKLPNLRTLLVNQNRLPSMSSGITSLTQLKQLDISGNSGNQISRSYFRLDDCSFKNMHNLEQLQLAYNLLTQITQATFIGLDNLKYLGLKNATIFTMEFGTFRRLNRLEYLNLESNKFTIILQAEIFEGLSELKTLLLGCCFLEHLHGTPSPFYYLKNLTYLGLQGNWLYTLSSSIFSPLAYLKNLDVSQNKLLEWTDTNFKNKSYTIENINLSQNKIKSITVAMLEDFKNLVTLNLDGNPFTCDCLMLQAANWLYQNNYSFQYIKNNGLNAKCVNPDEWSQISILNFLVNFNINEESTKDCEYEQKNEHIILIVVLSLVTVIICTTSGFGYVYRSHVRHWLLLFRMTLRRQYLRAQKIRNTSNTVDTSIEGNIYKYDAFVSYSNEDETFVVELVTMLEDHEPYFKLCVYERDFQIGSTISESVLHSVASSKRTILIVSDAFAKSQWCRWEAKLAEHHHLFFQDADIKGPYGTLLMILLGDVKPVNISPTLKYLLKTRIYLEWSEEPEKKIIFWDKLRKKLSTPNNYSYQSRTQMSQI